MPKNPLETFGRGFQESVLSPGIQEVPKYIMANSNNPDPKPTVIYSEPTQIGNYWYFSRIITHPRWVDPVEDTFGPYDNKDQTETAIELTIQRDLGASL